MNNPTPGGSAYLYPGAGSQTFAFTVTNNDGGNQGLNQVVATVAPDAAAATAGCQASWYDVSINGQAATATTQTYTYSSVDDVPSGGVVDVPVVLTMPDANTNQNACEGDDPVVTLSAS